MTINNHKELNMGWLRTAKVEPQEAHVPKEGQDDRSREVVCEPVEKEVCDVFM